MGDIIHPCPENDSAGTATVTDYVDPLYEFRAPMYYDFTNPNEDVYDGDLWFDYHEDDLASPLVGKPTQRLSQKLNERISTPKSRESLDIQIVSSPFQKHIEKTKAIKEKRIKMIQSKPKLPSLKQSLRSSTYMKNKKDQRENLSPIEAKVEAELKNMKVLTKPKLTETKKVPRYMAPTRSLMYGINKIEPIDENKVNQRGLISKHKDKAVKNTTFKPNVILKPTTELKPLNNKTGTQNKTQPSKSAKAKFANRKLVQKSSILKPINKVVEPSKIQFKYNKNTTANDQKRYMEPTFSQMTAMNNPKVKTSDKENTEFYSPFRLKEQMKIHGVTKCTPETLKRLRDMRRRPLTIPVTPEFMRRHRVKDVQ